MSTGQADVDATEGLAVSDDAHTDQQPVVLGGEGGDTDGVEAPHVVEGGEAAEDEDVDLTALDLEGSLEAILMVADEPIPTVLLAQVLRRPQPEVEATLRQLARQYTEQARGFDLREVAGGWRFYSRQEFAPAVQHFVLDGQQARLTQAALETLAVVAYRQPVSRARVSAIRGVNVDSVMRTLTARGLVEEAGEDPSTGAHLYRTTSYFLERLGIADLAELPDLPPHLPTVEDLEAEL